MQFSVGLQIRLITIGFLFSAVIGQTRFAKAEVTFTEGGITGVSYFDLAEKKIYGGVAGVCSSISAGSTCNTCTDTSGGLKPCNQKSIHSSLTINFTFKSTADLTGKTLKLKVGTSTGDDELKTLTGTAAGSTYTFQTTWGAYCSKVASLAGATVSANCEANNGSGDGTATTVSFFIYEDSTNTSSKTEIPVVFHAIPSTGYTSANIDQTFGAGNYGLYKYLFRAGDSKLILQEADTLISTTMPSGTPELYAIAYFLDRQDNPTNPLDTSLFANGKNTIVMHRFNKTTVRLDDGPYIQGLQNGSQYCVVTGQVNKTQNILAFTTLSVDSSMACATPNVVVGLLEDKKCFISTAAFGSDMADEVVLFRRFRDNILLKTSFGKWFVKKYYLHSPPWADFIARSDYLRAAVRFGLYPLLGFAWLSLQIGPLPALFFTLLILVGLFQLRRNLRWSFGK